MKEHPVSTQDRIIDAGRRLFHERGYHNVGVADLCREAQVVKGSFYHFYPTKEDLLIDTVQRNWQQLQSALESLEKDSRPARQCLESLLTMIVEHAQMMHCESDAIYGCRLGTIATELGPQQGRLQSILRSVMQQWAASIRRLIERGVTDGSIAANVAAAPTANALLASIQGMSVLGRTFNDPGMLRDISALAMRQVPENPMS